jgi:hypothetical protein
MKEAGITPFFVIKDSYTFQNREILDFYKYIWLDVSSVAWKDNQFTFAAGSDYRPCTLEDFDN